MCCKITCRLGLIILLLPAIAGAGDPTRLTTLDWDGGSLVLGFDGPFDGTPWRMAEPDRLIIDFDGVRSGLIENRYDGVGVVEGVRIGQNEPEQKGGLRCRVVLDLSSPGEYDYDAEDGILRITVRGEAADSEIMESAAAPARDDAERIDPLLDSREERAWNDPFAFAAQAAKPKLAAVPIPESKSLTMKEPADSASPLPEPFPLVGRQFASLARPQWQGATVEERQAGGWNWLEARGDETPANEPADTVADLSLTLAERIPAAAMETPVVESAAAPRMNPAPGAVKNWDIMTLLESHANDPFVAVERPAKSQVIEVAVVPERTAEIVEEKDAAQLPAERSAAPVSASVEKGGEMAPVTLPVTGFSSLPEAKKQPAESGKSRKSNGPPLISAAGLGSGGWVVETSSAAELRESGTSATMKVRYYTDPFVAEANASVGAIETDPAVANEIAPAGDTKTSPAIGSETIPASAPGELPVNLADWRSASATTVPSAMQDLLAPQTGEERARSRGGRTASIERDVVLLESDTSARPASAEKPLARRRTSERVAGGKVLQLAQASNPPQSDRGSMNPPKEAAKDPDALILRGSRVKPDAAPISLDMRGADFRTVLRAFSEFSGQNIIGSREVKGKISVQLKDMPWREALFAVCSANGFGIVEEHGLLRISQKKQIVQEEMEQLTAEKKRMEYRPLATEVTNLYYAQATELTAPLGKMLSSRGKIDVDVRTNSLLVTDLPGVVDKIIALAHVLDRPMPQVEIIARIVDLDYRTSRDLGIRWEAINLSSSSTDLVGSAVVDATYPEPVGEFKIGTVRTLGELNLTLQAMEKDNKANIISNPRVMTMDNREASILVGKKIPLIVADEAGNAITQLVTVGIKLRVTPHINPEGQIMLDLHTEVSDLASEATVQGGVIITTSESHTKVMVNSGETAVIAGLIKTGDSELHSHVPILGKIPILGRLFGYENTTDSKRELIIFVTPRILEASASSSSSPDFRSERPEG